MILAKVFDRLIGNEQTRKVLYRAALNKTFSHAYMICGPDGSGKKTLTEEFISSVLCTGDASLSFPCRECQNCIKIRKRISPDVKFIVPLPDNKTIGVKAVREALEDLFVLPNDGDFKFYVIENAELLTPAAQNCLLKSLEDPPRFVIFILLAPSSEIFLDTVISRVRLINMQKITKSQAEEYFDRFIGKGDKARFLSLTASFGGTIGRAADIFDGGDSSEIKNLENAKKLLNLILSPSDKIAGSDISKFLTGSNAEAKKTLITLDELLSDVVRYKMNPKIPPDYFTSYDEIPGIKKLTLKRLTGLCDVTKDAIAKIDRSVNFKNMMQFLANEYGKC